MAKKTKKTKTARPAVVLVNAPGGYRKFAALPVGASIDGVKLGANVVRHGDTLYTIRTGEGYDFWGSPIDTAASTVNGVVAELARHPFSVAQIEETVKSLGSRGREGAFKNVRRHMLTYLVHRDIIVRDGKLYRVTPRGLALATAAGVKFFAPKKTK